MDPRAERLAHLLEVRAALAAAKNVSSARADSPSPEERRPPPEPCYLNDHRYCGTGPVLKRPAGSAVTTSDQQPKETP